MISYGDLLSIGEVKNTSEIRGPNDTLQLFAINSSMPKLTLNSDFSLLKLDFKV